MRDKAHTYTCNVTWTGNRGKGTSSCKAYSRDHAIAGAGKPEPLGSADPAVLGDAKRYNPEELLLASVSTCHWYLQLRADAKVAVIAYRDAPVGTLVEDANSCGRFTGVRLRPHVTIAKAGDLAKACELHHAAHAKCYVANPVSFSVTCEPQIIPARA